MLVPLDDRVIGFLAAQVFNTRVLAFNGNDKTWSLINALAPNAPALILVYNANLHYELVVSHSNTGAGFSPKYLFKYDVNWQTAITHICN